jgi:hypothetical protein
MCTKIGMALWHSQMPYAKELGHRITMLQQMRLRIFTWYPASCRGRIMQWRTTQQGLSSYWTKIAWPPFWKHLDVLLDA